MTLTIRPAVAGDAAAMGHLAKQFNHYLRSLGDTVDFNLDEAAILRDGFGRNPAFSGLVAELKGVVVGYLLYHFGYDADLAVRNLHVIDLYVEPAARRQGAGRALLAAAAEVCRQAGGSYLFWAVYAPNTLAAEFYEGIGARYTEDLRFMTLIV